MTEAPVAEEPADEPTEPQAESARLSGLALYVAAGALGVWALFTIYLLTQVNAEEVTWTRIAWVFASVEAIAFAAAGALFGTAVQRANVEKAEERADSAEGVADFNREDATKGRVLAASLQADAAGGASFGDADGFDEVRGMDTPSGSSGDAVDRHAAMSRSLFGDLLE